MFMQSNVHVICKWQIFVRGCGQNSWGWDGDDNDVGGVGMGTKGR